MSIWPMKLYEKMQWFLLIAIQTENTVTVIIGLLMKDVQEQVITIR